MSSNKPKSASFNSNSIGGLGNLQGGMHNFSAAIINLMPDPVWVIDPENRILACNTAFNTICEHFFGERLIENTDFFQPPVSKNPKLALFFSMLFHNAHSAKTHTEVLEFLTDDKEHYFEFNTQWIQEAAGATTIVVIGKNISGEIKKAALAAQKDARLLLASAGNNDGLIDWNIKTGLAWYNTRIFTILGCDNTEHSEGIEKLEGAIHPDDFQFYQFNIKDYLSRRDSDQDSLRIECRLRHVAGYYLNFDIRGCAVWDSNGKPNRLVLTLRDITERSGMLEVMARNKYSLRAILENTEDAIWSIDSEYKIIILNSATTKLAQIMFNASVVAGSNTLAHLPEAAKKIWIDIYERGFAGEQFKMVREANVNGRQFFFEICINPIRDKLGYVNGVSVFMRDVSVYKRSEEELQDITLQLEKHVQHLQKYSYITSHNLRAPVINMVSLLEFFNLDNPQDAANHKLMPDLINSVHQLHNTINDLLSVTEIRHRNEERCDILHFNEIFQSSILYLESAIKDSGAVISTDFSAAEKVSFPKTFLQNVLRNLISNAIKYAKPTVKPVIGIRTSHLGDYTLLTVSDNGLGIDTNKYHGRLFGLYQRLHDHVPGKGLGLYAVRSQVEAMGGYVDLESTPGKGSTFKIYFKGRF